MQQEFDEAGTPGPVVVRVVHDGLVAHEERCQSADEVLAVIEAWEDVDGTRFEIVDERQPSRGPMPPQEFFSSVEEPLLDDPQRG